MAFVTNLSYRAPRRPGFEWDDEPIDAVAQIRPTIDWLLENDPDWVAQKHPEWLELQNR